MQTRLKSSSSIMLGGVAAAVMLTLSVGATPAEARPARHQQSQVPDHQAEGADYQARALNQRATNRSVRSPHARSGVPHAASVRVSATHKAGEGQQRTASAADTDVVREARRWLGGNPTRRSRLWCAARSFASYGHRVSGPQIGAIAVMVRKGGGHVGVVSGVDASGNPIVISGNHGHRVAEAVYPSRRVYAYVMP